jgi:hypothetical protein
VSDLLAGSLRKVLRYATFALLAVVSTAAPCATQLTPPEQPYALRFSDRRIAIAPDHETLNLGEAFTLEAWVYFDDVTDAIILGRPGSGSVISHYDLRLVDGGTVISFIQGTGEAGQSNAVNVAASLSLNTWTHFAGTLGDGVLRLYLNGDEVGLSDSPGLPHPNPPDAFVVGNEVSTSNGLRGRLRRSEFGAGPSPEKRSVRMRNDRLSERNRALPRTGHWRQSVFPRSGAEWSGSDAGYRRGPLPVRQ